MQSCYFLGGALHTALGADLESQVDALAAGPSAPGSAIASYAGQQRELLYQLLAGCPIGHARQRFIQSLDRVVNQALEAAQLTVKERAATGLFLGTSSFDISVHEDDYRAALTQTPNTFALENCSSQSELAFNLRKRFGLRGPDYSFNTACTSSANALIYADAMIRSGQLQHAVVVGVEIFNSITALGFHGLQLLTSNRMRPFDKARSGLVLGEGCGALVLGTTQPARNQWQLCGSANQCDTHSMSGTNPDGSAIAAVMRQALDQAQLQPDHITAIKTHGTASIANDAAEAHGMRQVFTKMPPLTALKPYLGHTLGACGVIELLLYCAAADRGFLIATPGIGMDTGSEDDLGVQLNQTPCSVPHGHHMLNYFGFGGNNTVLIISNLKDEA